jgi:hypothetical protein
MKFAKLSAPHTGRFYTPGKVPDIKFCYRLGQQQGLSAPGRTELKKIARSLQRIEPARFQRVAQCLNKMHYRVPPCFVWNTALIKTIRICIRNARLDVGTASSYSAANFRIRWYTTRRFYSSGVSTHVTSNPKYCFAPAFIQTFALPRPHFEQSTLLRCHLDLAFVRCDFQV